MTTVAAMNFLYCNIIISLSLFLSLSIQCIDYLFILSFTFEFFFLVWSGWANCLVAKNEWQYHICICLCVSLFFTKSIHQSNIKQSILKRKKNDLSFKITLNMNTILEQHKEVLRLNFDKFVYLKSLSFFWNLGTIETKFWKGPSDQKTKRKLNERKKRKIETTRTCLESVFFFLQSHYDLKNEIPFEKFIERWEVILRMVEIR